MLNGRDIALVIEIHCTNLKKCHRITLVSYIMKVSLIQHLKTVGRHTESMVIIYVRLISALTRQESRQTRCLHSTGVILKTDQYAYVMLTTDKIQTLNQYNLSVPNTIFIRFERKPSTRQTP